eukprot:48518-Eustigmatos_ZCMA.PRE.1
MSTECCDTAVYPGVQLQHHGEGQGMGSAHGLHSLCGGAPHPFTGLKVSSRGQLASLTYRK